LLRWRNIVIRIRAGGFRWRRVRGGEKDWKVLLVDISALPAQFGKPSTPSGNVAVTVAGVILRCRSGD